MGLDYEALKKKTLILFMLVKGFAEGSPYENFLSFDMIGQSAGGVLSITGEPDGKPCKPGVTLADTGTGMLMAITILGALYDSRRQEENISSWRCRML